VITDDQGVIVAGHGRVEAASCSKRCQFSQNERKEKELDQQAEHQGSRGGDYAVGLWAAADAEPFSSRAQRQTQKTPKGFEKCCVHREDTLERKVPVH